MKTALLLTATAMALCGCSTCFSELHYFKSTASTSGAIPNYYRLTVKGGTLFSSARYISGYFDEESIDMYFNEFTQPTGGGIQPKPVRDQSSSGGTASTTGGTGSVQAIDKGLKEKKLIMILSSNSDDVANQIGALVASKQFTASLAGLLAREEYALAEDTKRNLASDQTQAKMIADLGDQIFRTLPAEPSSAELEQKLLEFVNRLAATLGYQGSFPDLDAAATWLEFHRSRLLRGEQ